MADKRLSIRISDELWQKARIIMTKRNLGENFQSICEQAIQEYVEKYKSEPFCSSSCLTRIFMVL